MFCHFCSVTKPCPTLWDPVDCSLPGSSAHGILQTRTLEWVALPFSTTQCEYYFKCQINTALYAHLLPLKISFRLKFCSSTGLGALLPVCLWTSDPDLSLLLTVALTGPPSHSLLLPELSLSLIVSQSAPVSLNIFISVSLCVLVWFSFLLFVSVSALVAHSVSLYFPPLLLALSLLISIALFLSLIFGLCIPLVTVFLTLSRPLFLCLQTFPVLCYLLNLAFSVRLSFCLLGSSSLSLLLFLSLHPCLSLSFF